MPGPQFADPPPMPPGSPVRRRAGVLAGGHLVLALALAALLAAPPAVAQDGGKKGGDAQPAPAPPKEKSEEEKDLEAVGAEWKAGNVGALAARFPAKRRVSLRLPDSDAGEYRAQQAKSVLEDYFSGRSFSRVELKSCRESTGTFEIEYQRSADRKKVKAELLVVLGVEEKKRVVTSIRESP